MTSKFQRLIACILLVLLPLPALASAAMCAHMRQAPATGDVQEAAMEHCSMSSMGEETANERTSGTGEREGNSCCSAAAACGMCSVSVNTQPAQKLTGAHEQPDISILPQYTSFIPEGLQRPPSIPA